MDDDRAVFGVVDYSVFALLLVVSVGIGVYTALRGAGNTSTSEYLLGGRRMNPIPVGISLLGGIISAISIIGNATEMYYHGTQLSINLVGCIVGTLLTQAMILPILYPLGIVSINEYLEQRFKSSAIRKMATSCQLLQCFIYMGICLYAPALTLSTVTSLPTWASILTMGTICTFYITIGGVKAVVYTDVVQTLLMFVGVLVVVVVCCADLGGVGQVWAIADQGQRIEFFNMNPSPFERHTFWTALVHGTYLIVGYVGLNQQTYQRFASVATLQLSRRLCTFFLIGLYVLWVLFYFSGLVAYAVYSSCDPLTAGVIEKADQILPYLVVDRLGHLTGMAGLFVAAVYGGVLSSISSSANSVACIIWEDFLKGSQCVQGVSDQRATNIIKLLSVVTGVLAMCLGLLVGRLGTIFQLTQSVLGALSGPLAGVFIAGMCLPWANKQGAVAGFLTSFTLLVWLVVGKFVRGGASPTTLPLTTVGCAGNTTIHAVTEAVVTEDYMWDVTEMPEDDHARSLYDISYCYNGTLGVLITLVVCGAVSAATGKMEPDKELEHLLSPSCYAIYSWLWRGVAARHHQEKLHGKGSDHNDKERWGEEGKGREGKATHGYDGRDEAGEEGMRLMTSEAFTNDKKQAS